MAKNKRMFRAAKRTATALLALSVGTEVCGAHAGKHIEQRQYQEPPTATYESAYSTATPPTIINGGLWEFMTGDLQMSPKIVLRLSGQMNPRSPVPRS